MSEDKVAYIGTTNRQRTPMDVLEQCQREFPDMKDVYILFYDAEGHLQRRTSHMSNQAALWMLATEQRDVLAST